MVAKQIALILGLTCVVLFAINRFQKQAAADEFLRLQTQHNEQVLALNETARKADSIKAAEIDSLKSVLAVKVRQLARVNARADSLSSRLDSLIDDLPGLVPAQCEPWAQALTTCSQALAAKDSVAKGLTIAVEQATAYSDSLGILYVRAQERGDSLAHNLQLTNEAIDKSRCSIIFVACPSRTTSFIIGTSLGLLVGFGVK